MLSHLEILLKLNLSLHDCDDAALQTQVNTEKARIDSIMSLSSADLDSFKEIVDAYTGADSSLQTLITTLTATVSQLRADFDAHIN